MEINILKESKIAKDVYFDNEVVELITIGTEYTFEVIEEGNKRILETFIRGKHKDEEEVISKLRNIVNYIRRD